MSSTLHARVTSLCSSMLLGSSLVFGMELGMFQALATHRYTFQQLATHLHLDHRYTAEWLLHMLANQIITHDPNTLQYWLDDEQRKVLADEADRQYGLGGVEFAYGCNLMHPLLLQRWQTSHTQVSTGIQHHELHPHVTDGLRRWFTVNYLHLLTQYWIPCISADIIARIDTGGAHIADVGCGHGTATQQLARRFASSHVYGFDYDSHGVSKAQQLAQQAELNNMQFVTAGAADFARPDGGKFDLIFYFAAFHDMSDPAQIIKHTKRQLSSNGAVILVEPYAGDTVQQTCQHPAGALFSGVSLHYCVACAKSLQTGCDDDILGAVASNRLYHKLWVEQGGFRSLLVLQPRNTPNNRLFEILP